MTGLEKILKAIEAEATANVEAILQSANREAEEILANANQEASKKCAEIAAKSEAAVKEILSRAESAAALQEKKKLLDAKQQIISNIIANAKTSLANLPDSEYMEIILRMVKKYAHNQPGIIMFTAADKKRFPENFPTVLKNALAEKKAGADLTVATENAVIDGGFILKYGDIEENCSFDAIFNAAKEELQDKVNTLLFEK